jgi:hypothetical protein
LSHERRRRRERKATKPGIGCDCVLRLCLKLRLKISRQAWEFNREALAVIGPTHVLLTLSCSPVCYSLTFAFERTMRPAEPNELERPRRIRMMRVCDAAAVATGFTGDLAAFDGNGNGCPGAAECFGARREEALSFTCLCIVTIRRTPGFLMAAIAASAAAPCRPFAVGADSSEHG